MLYCNLVHACVGLDRQDGKRPDGLTLIPWHGGRSLVWDVTVVSPLAASYVDRAATDAGTVADMTATRKTEKYSTMPRINTALARAA